MATKQWLGGAGDWATGSLWSGGVAPDDAATVAVIAVAGTYAVTIGSAETFSVGGATLDNGFATLAIGYNGADLDLSGGTFDLAAGTLSLNGALSDGTLDLAGGALAIPGGTLSAITVVGELDLGPGDANVMLENGFTIDNPVAGAQGTIALTAFGLHFVGTQALTDDLLRIGSSTDLYASNGLYVDGTLAIDQASTLEFLGASSFVDLYTGGRFVTGGGYVADSLITNAGLITLAGTGEHVIAELGGFSNAGSIGIGSSDQLTIDLGFDTGEAPGGYVNSGTISIAAGGELYLGAAVSAAGYGTVLNTGGTVVLAGTFDNTANALVLGTTGGFTDTVLQGTLAGGTIDPAGGKLVFSGGTLDGVTWNAGSFDVAAGQTVTVENGFFLAPGADTITVEGALIFADGETLSGDTIGLTGTLGTSGTGTLTIGAGTTIAASGNAALAGTVVNLGSIGVAGGTLAVDFTAASGHGSISVASGATLSAGGTFALASLGTLNELGVLAIAGTLLNIGQTLDILAGGETGNLALTGTVLGGVVALDGGIFAASGGATFDGVAEQGPLALTGAQAALTVIDGISLSGSLGAGPGTLLLTGSQASLTIGDAETIDSATILIGSTPSGATINIATTLTLGPAALLETTGTGSHSTIASNTRGTLVNQGTIAATASLSSLIIAAALDNTGTLEVANGATIELYSAGSGGTQSVASIGSILNTGGVLELYGNFDNTGNTIDIAPGSGFATLELGYGPVIGGVIRADGGSFIATGGELDGVTFEGPIDLSAAGSRLDLVGVTLLGSLGSGPGEIVLTGSGGILNIGRQDFSSESETLDNSTITIGNAAGGADSIVDGYYETVTFGTGLVIDNVGTGGATSIGGPGTIINLGSIIAESSGGILTLGGSGSFANQGTVFVEAGATLALKANGTLGGFGDIVLDGGVIQITGTIQNTGSTLAVAPGGLLGNTELAGVVIGGTIADEGGTLTFAGGTLDGVTVLGALDLATRTSTLSVLGGLTLAGTAGGVGTIALTAAASILNINDSETLDNVLIEIGNAGTAYNDPDLLLALTTLTLGAGATIVDSVAGGIANVELGDYGRSIVNQGTVVVDGVGALLNFGADFYSPSYPPANGFVNDGTVVIGEGATFNVVEDGSLQALGTIINTGGTLELSGSYSNSGIFTVAAGNALEVNAIIAGGTLAANGGTLLAGNATLNDVDVLASTIRLVQGDGGLTLGAGTTLQAASGPTAVEVAANFSHIILGDGQTLDNVVASFTTTGLSFELEAASYASVTFGVNTTFDVAGAGNALYLVGAFDIIAFGDQDPGTIVSEGLISVGAGAELVVEISSFANTGTIALATGAEIGIGTYTSLTAAGLGTVQGSGGTLLVGGTFDLGGGAIDLGGAFGAIDLTQGTIANGTIIGDGGTLAVALGGLLSNVTLDGPVLALAASAGVSVAQNLVVRSADGTGPGTLAVTAAGSEVEFNGSQTFDNATVIVSGAVGTFAAQYIDNQDPGVATNGTLTLGTNLLVTNPNSGTGGGLGGPGTIINEGTIAVGAGATIEVTPYGAFTGAPLFTNLGVMTIGAGGLLAIDTDVTTASIGNVIEAGGTLGFGGFLNNTGATLAITGGGTLDAVSFGVIAEGQTYVDSIAVGGGTIVNDGGQAIFRGFTSFDTLTYEGGLFIGAGAVLELLHSTVMAIGGGAETITLAGGLSLAGDTLDDTVIAFAGTAAEVTYNATDGLAASLVGFSAGDSIVVDTFGVTAGTITTLAYDGTDLVAFDGASAVTTLAVGAGYVADDFSFTATDYSDYVITTTQEVSQPAPCFVAGTRIATPDGPRPVEALAIGDLVVTASGESRRIRWIGRRSYHGRFIAGNRDILPIVIRRGALADGVPARTLRVSPKHALFLDGALVPAERLVNGHSIVQLKTVKKLSYLHIELDSHDVLLAEGAPAESFVDRDSRMMFQNASEFFRRYPGETARESCAERLDSGARLEAIRRRIAARAGQPEAGDVPRGGIDARIDALDGASISGWAFCAAQPHTPVQLDIQVDGVCVATVIANAERSDLAKAGLGRGWCAFSHSFATPLVAGAGHVVSLSGNGESLVTRSLRQAPVKHGILDGRLDVCDGRVVGGWARDNDDPGRPVRLEILCDGVIAGHAIADRARADLTAAGLGACAFTMVADQAVDGAAVLVRRAADGAILARRDAQKKRAG